MYVVEGVELVRLAVNGGQPVEALYVDGNCHLDDVAKLCAHARSTGIQVFSLAPGVLEKVTSTVTPQPLLAVVPMRTVALDAVLPGLVVVLADVRDPGNAGTLIRTAEAAGVAAIVLAGQCVDPFNPKTVRASAGAVLWTTLCVSGEVQDTIRAMQERGFRVLGTEARGGVPYDQTDWTGSVAMVLGNEAHGLDAASVSLLDGTVTIAMAGEAESLNVGVAGAVLCFEALKQRRGTTNGVDGLPYDGPNRIAEGGDRG